jgi:choline monooxygenase
MATLVDKLAVFDDALPLQRARTLPALWYHDAEIYEAERERVFGRTWQALGSLGTGNYLAGDVAGEPVLVTRDEDGALRGFYNVCRHRAATLLCGAGTASRIRCRYHGWTYDLKGQLKGTPEFEGVDEFRKEDNGLRPVRAGRFGPLAFVNLDGAGPRLDEHLARIAERAFDDLRFHGRKTYSLQCNWKVFVDNYLDGGYHVNTIHPGLAQAIDYSRYRIDVFENCSVQTSPVDSAADMRQGTACYWWVFPNLMINLYDGLGDTNIVVPRGPERCDVHIDFYFAERLTAAEIDKSVAVTEQIQWEDIRICEEVQRGLQSKSYDTGRFSVTREAGGYHFHQLLARSLRVGPPFQADKSGSKA